MGELSTTYDPAEIYNNPEASGPKYIDLKFKTELLGPEPNIMLKTSRIIETSSNFDKICKAYVRNKQTRVIR